MSAIHLYTYTVGGFHMRFLMGDRTRPLGEKLMRTSSGVTILYAPLRWDTLMQVLSKQAIARQHIIGDFA
jgi:hypothetical protein